MRGILANRSSIRFIVLLVCEGVELEHSIAFRASFIQYNRGPNSLIISFIVDIPQVLEELIGLTLQENTLLGVKVHALVQTYRLIFLQSLIYYFFQEEATASVGVTGAVLRLWQAGRRYVHRCEVHSWAEVPQPRFAYPPGTSSYIFIQVWRTASDIHIVQVTCAVEYGVNPKGVFKVIQKLKIPPRCTLEYQVSILKVTQFQKGHG